MSLADSGAGTLRDASGPCKVVFAVSGYIDISTQLNIYNPGITIAGQTSPNGITLCGN
jgi:hypothetical protein